MVTLTVILLFVNGAFKIMENQLTTSVFSDGFDRFLNLFNTITGELENFLFAADKIHILSLTLTALALVSVFFAVLFILTKLSSFFFGNKPSVAGSNEQTSPLSENPSEENSVTELETELESELTKNSSSPAQETFDIPENIKEEQDERSFIAREQSYDDGYQEQPRHTKENNLVELDWQKSKTGPQPITNTQKNPETSLNLRKNIRDLIGMIVNMIGRHIDELKIAQALMYRCKDDLSEETVLQIVTSVKEFLDLCKQGAFTNVRRLKDLPDEEESILRLIAGDPSYAMALLEALMDEKINQAVNLKNTAQRNALFRQSSNYACYFGTLAEMCDTNLASASFELAVEMNPENTLAWSRCADLYKQAGLDDKANWAYRNVLKIANKERDLSQEANARKFLSQYLYAQGESVQASELYLASKSYYDSIGINRPLDRKELEIIQLIDQTNTENIIAAVLPQNQNSI
ncbi:MAG: hypothetical protein IJ545_00380 [Alphaproteobacteria bacterium]|nr:hypothetical protein [Alphaproteobacteria bacterium]